MIGFSCRYLFQHPKANVDVVQQQAQLFDLGGAKQINLSFVSDCNAASEQRRLHDRRHYAYGLKQEGHG